MENQEKDKNQQDKEWRKRVDEARDVLIVKNGKVAEAFFDFMETELRKTQNEVMALRQALSTQQGLVNKLGGQVAVLTAQVNAAQPFRK